MTRDSNLGASAYSLRDFRDGKKKDAPAAIKRGKAMRYVSLHHHSTYSFLDGYGLPADHVRRSAELGMQAMALTEHGNVSSHPKLEQAAQETGIKPLYGCELYTNGKEQAKKKNHLTVLAASEEGYRNLLRVLSWAWDEGFYYEPTVRGHVLAAHKRDLIILSGCHSSLLSTSLVGGKNIPEEEASFERGLEVARRFKRTFGDSYYLEVQAFPELEKSRQINAALEEIGRRMKIPLVATADVHYTHPEENQMQVILHATRPGQNRTVEEQARSWGYDVLLSHPTSDKEMYDRLVGTGLSPKAAKQAILSTEEISQRCTVALPKAAQLRFPMKPGQNIRDEWRKWLREGWDFRRINDKSNSEEYAQQLEHEVKIIEGKDFMDYFLIVSDMVRWAKDNNILVGPARGSAAASLVCYLLRITEVDPLLFPDLVFERFIDVTRQDLPDIDLDFDDQRRHEVLEYLAHRYGQENVGHLGTFTTYKSKNSLDDVARVYRIPSWEVARVKELLIERSSGDLRASATIEDTVEMFPEAKEVFDAHPDLYASTRLEGMVKGMGKHAAGAIVSSAPITDTCAVYRGTISLDKYDAEYMNLLKIDVLGLSTCGLLAEAMEMLGRPVTSLYDIPLDDPETLKGFKEDDLVGIFQFDGRAMRLVNTALKPDSFYEVCVVNALARPGPLHNNAMTDYVDIKHGVAEPNLLHPIYNDIVANTQYQVVYQEQILRIVREIGNFDWTHAAYIRKIISRKIGDQEFNRQWGKFWKGARENGVTKELAEKIWGMCITAGSYAFNAAHSVSYGMLGWWCMWLKRHHPQIFYAAALRRLNKDKHLELMRDAVDHGVKILTPDPATSRISWALEGEDALRAGFSQIPGIGPKMAQTIVEYREEEGIGTWEDLINVKGIGQITLEKMLAWVNQPDPFAIHVLKKKLRKVVKEIRSGKLTSERGVPLPLPTHKVSDIPYGRSEDTEVVWIGVVVNRNLRDLFEINMSKTGVPLKPEEVTRPDLREWALLYGTDGGDIFTLKISRWDYPRFKDAVWNIDMERDLVLIRGTKRGSMPHRMVHVRDMWVIS